MVFLQAFKYELFIVSAIPEGTVIVTIGAIFTVQLLIVKLPVSVKLLFIEWLPPFIVPEVGTAAPAQLQVGVTYTVNVLVALHEPLVAFTVYAVVVLGVTVTDEPDKLPGFQT
jgi:hypothetical protein